MTDNRHPAPEPAGESADASLWERLRQSVNALAAVGERRSDTESLAARLAARAKLLRGRMQSAAAEEDGVIVVAFNRGRERYAVSIENVLEAQAVDHFTQVPHTPAFLPGVIHWRGSVLALLDVGLLMGIPPQGIADVHVCLIIEAAGRRLALLASEVEEVRRIGASQIKPAPHLPGGAASDWVQGVYDDNRLILRPQQMLGDDRLVNWGNHRTTP